jgi:hypothetical protein
MGWNLNCQFVIFGSEMKNRGSVDIFLSSELEYETPYLLTIHLKYVILNFEFKKSFFLPIPSYTQMLSQG